MRASSASRCPDRTCCGSSVFGGYRGILWIAPVLAVAPLGYLAAARVLPRAAMVVLLLVPALYFLINSGYYYWDGGFSTGPRHVTPSLAFLWLPLAWAWARAGVPARVGFACLAGASAALSLLCASTDMAADQSFANPLLDYLIPRFLAGEVYNALASVGVHGWRSLLALPALWLLAAPGGLAATLDRRARPDRAATLGARRSPATNPARGAR
jgi:hypothetical protein